MNKHKLILLKLSGAKMQTLTGGDCPTVTVTNDDGIDAPGLRAIVRVLISTNRFRVFVCASDSEKSAVSHTITWRNAISAKPVEISGTIAFAVSGQWITSGK